VTSTRIAYSIDRYLRNGDPRDVYYSLYWAILADFARGLSPAERGVVSLGDIGAHNGVLAMARECGLSSLLDAASLMDAIGEPGLARLLCEGEAVIREQAAKSGVDSESLEAGDPEIVETFHREAGDRLRQIDSRVASLSSPDEPDAGLRLYVKTLAYVR
jgi:hypothetical protein